MSPTPKEDVCFITGYRKDTRNLVIAGLDNQLDDVEKRLNEHEIPVKIIPTSLPYERIPSIIDDSGNNMLVYLIQTNDIFGSQLSNLANNAQQYLDHFDSVDGLFWIGGESSGTVGCERIKVHGKYIGIYATPSKKTQSE